MSVRVRFAPSPTGHLHVGGARTAIFNWLFARRHGGSFIVRVEDTDETRSTRESEAMVLDDLRWLGLDWDEGPETGGPHGPYRQSERLEHYARAAKQLLETRRAYRCFCREEELQERREAAERAGLPPHYDGTCRRLAAEVSSSREAAGEPFVVRFHVPRDDESFDGNVTIVDIIRGVVSWKAETLGDFIVLRSDGMPTYNFCVVADDHEMGITHVIRAEEHLTNTHRQVLIYRALGWPVPEFAHVSLILGEDRTKLSKRHGATSVSAFAEKGILPVAMFNYLSLLGWSFPDGREQFTPLEAATVFSLDRINPAPAIFDETKLRWLNSQHIHAMPPEDLAPLLVPFFEQEGWLSDGSTSFLEQVAAATGRSIHTLDESVGLVRFLFEWDGASIMRDPVLGELVRAAGAEFLDAMSDASAEVDPVDVEASRRYFDLVRERSGRKGKALFMPLRIVLTGQEHGLELVQSVPLIQAAARSGETVANLDVIARIEALRREMEQA